MKDNFLTLKVKISTLHCKSGTCRDFALFVKDNVHDPKAPTHVLMLVNILRTQKATSAQNSSQKLEFHTRDFFLCENEVDLIEDRQLPVQKALEQVSNKKVEAVFELSDDETSKLVNAGDENSSEISF